MDLTKPFSKTTSFGCVSTLAIYTYVIYIHFTSTKFLPSGRTVNLNVFIDYSNLGAFLDCIASEKVFDKSKLL